MHSWERAQSCRVPQSQQSPCFRFFSIFHKNTFWFPFLHDARASLALRAGEKGSGGGVLGAGEPAGVTAVRDTQPSVPSPRDTKSPESLDFFQRMVLGSNISLFIKSFPFFSFLS